ncbi:hypothetical protein F4782DRAFT_317449 [Xylaria castorea]|nr:hypothetical protein F4782DRAFT_317449 [Xylaria castorea]
MMSSLPPRLQVPLRAIDEAAAALWKQTCTDQDIRVFHLSAYKLWLQTTIQSDLLKGAERLRGSSTKHINQRIKNFIRFTFSSSSDTADETRRERRISLRQLNHSSLALCGLTYTINEIETMRGQCFAFIIKNIANFIQIHGLSIRLCSRSITTAMGDCANMMTDDPDRLEVLINSCYNASYLSAIAASEFFGNTNFLDVQGSQSEAIHQGPVFCQLGTGPGTGQIPNASAADENLRRAKNPFYRHTQATNDILDYVMGPRLSAAIYSSRQWKSEREIRMARTDCIAITIPVDSRRDALISIWVGRTIAFDIKDDLDCQSSTLLTTTRQQLSSGIPEEHCLLSDWRY